MGDRALVVFHNKDKTESSPVVYLHWSGSAVEGILLDLKSLMTSRLDDIDYSCARFIGLCHEQFGGNTSLGVMNDSGEFRAFMKSDGSVEEFSHGDAGIVFVDCSSFEWVAYGGYLQNR